MRQQPNPPDRDDAATERAVSMDTRPAEPEAGAGRAVNAAFSRRRPEGMPSPRTETTGQQDLRIEGPGYSSKDRDDVDPQGIASGGNPGGSASGTEDNPLSGQEEIEEDEDGYRTGELEAGLETGDGQLLELMPEVDRIPTSGGQTPTGGRAGHAPGMETGDGQLEELLEPPGGEDLGGDRDTDPNLNGGHGIRMLAPEEGARPIEEEDTEDSIIGQGHEAKAAWNRERVSHLQDIENEEREVRSATSEALGMGGAVLGGVLKGWEGGSASPTLDQGVDPSFDDELSETEEVMGDLRLTDAPDVLDDESVNDPVNMPFLPEDRDLPDDGVAIEERLIATEGEDAISAGAELGTVEVLDMEDLNETDNISMRVEDQRQRLNDAADGNELRGVRDIEKD